MNQVKKDELILLTIKRLGINGEGVGFYKKQTIFVDNALPGEIVEVKIVDAKDKYAIGEITKFKQKSPNRVEPKCPYYEKCGGCQLQHLSYQSQLEEKKNIVVESFMRYYDGKVEKIKFNDTIGCENPWRYRNKSSLPCRHDGDNVVVGMYASNSNHLVYINDCMIEEENIKNTRDYILSFLSSNNIDVYNPKTKTGSLRYLVIRSFGEDDIQVTFVLFKEDKKLLNILNKMNLKSIYYSVNSDPKSIEIFGEKLIHLKGKVTIDGKLRDLKFKISPRAFFQLNTKQTVVLYDEIKKACNLTGEEKVLDCYCGIGSIGMYLADKAKEVRGIDVNVEGIKDAKEFAKINQIDNIKFYSGNILPHLNQFEKDGFVPDVVVVDPPRKGLELNIINYFQKKKVKKIVYVSCNPATLAKNINHLQKNYVVKYVQPLDMFPNTANVETVVLLSHKSNNSKVNVNLNFDNEKVKKHIKKVVEDVDSRKELE